MTVSTGGVCGICNAVVGLGWHVCQGPAAVPVGVPSIDWSEAANELIAQSRARARELLMAELRADGWLIVAPGCVGVPRNADEAVGMVLLGTNYLEQHAPERLRHA